MSDLPDQRADGRPTKDAVDGPSATEHQAAGEAAQHVVDEVTSWNYSAERDTVEDRLDAGLDQAGVRLPEGERERVLDEIGEVKQDETRGTPQVRSAEVAHQA